MPGRAGLYIEFSRCPHGQDLAKHFDMPIGIAVDPDCKMAEEQL